MAKRLSCCVGVLLACGGAVDPKEGPARGQAADASQVVAAPGRTGTAASGSGGPLEPAELPAASPELPAVSPELPIPEVVDVPGETLAAAQAWPAALALDATHVYWANWGGYLEGGVQRISKDGGSPQVLARSMD